MSNFFRKTLYLTVFLTGAAVLVIEVTAVRMLTPYFGSSLFVLSSVLTIVLGALSVGYYAGGKLSDKLPTHNPLYVIIAWSGISVLLTQYLALKLLPTISPSFSHVVGPLAFSFVLFFLPAFLLGIVSPYIIKLQSLHTSPDHVGAVVGATFFWGTLGSIVGSLATGFVLVPLLGITSTITYTGIALFILGILGEELLDRLLHKGTSLRTKITENWKYLTLSFVIFVILFLLIVIPTRTEKDGVLAHLDGLYSQIIVKESTINDKKVHLLRRDQNHSSASYMDSDDLVFEYSQFAEYYPALKADTEDFLLLGGGAYSIPRTLIARDENIRVDVVEIEPVLFEIAQTYFGLTPSPRVVNKVMDARVYLQQSDKRYDVIFEDTFGTDKSIPAHLATREFFFEIREELKPEGVLLMNYIGSLSEHPPSLTGSIVKTVQSVFPNVKVYALRTQEPNKLQNFMVVARNGSQEIDLGTSTVLTTSDEIKNVPDLEVPLSRFAMSEELIFTDDHAPIEFLMLKQY